MLCITIKSNKLSYDKQESHSEWNTDSLLEINDQYTFNILTDKQGKSKNDESHMTNCISLFQNMVILTSSVIAPLVSIFFYILFEANLGPRRRGKNTCSKCTNDDISISLPTIPKLQQTQTIKFII